MCRSRAEGGQRCSTHARERVVAAGQAYGQAIAVGMLNMNQIKRTYDRLVIAEQEYASTTDGAESLKSVLAQEDVPREIQTRLRDALAIGKHLRERNNIIRRNAAALDSQGLLPGSTPTPGTDDMLRQALTDIRDHPDQYRTPLPPRSVIGVKTYATAEEQAAGVARWSEAVDLAARKYANCLRFAEMGVGSGTLNPNWMPRLTEAAYRLAVLAERLRTARTQTPTT